MQILANQHHTEQFIKNKYRFNLLFLLISNVVLCVLWIAFFAYAYSPQFYQYTGAKIAWLPELAATLRGVSIFILVWYVTTQILIGVLIAKRHPSIEKTDKICLYLNWTLIVGFYNIYRYIKETDFNYFKSWFLDLFASNYELKETFHRRSWQYIMMVCLTIFMSQLVFLCFIYPFTSNQALEIASFDIAAPTIKYVNSYNNLWFNSLQYFTNQTNLLCFAVALLFTINPSLKIFKHNSLLMFCAVYILVVGVIYNAALLPPKILNGSVANWSAMTWYENAIEHIFNPILFLVAVLFIVSNKRTYKPTNLVSHLFYGTITIFPYLTFAMFSTLFSANSVYDSITNLNPYVLTDFSKYVLGNNLITFNFLSNAAGEAFRIIYFPLFVSLFVVLLYVIHQLDHYSYRKFKKQATANTNNEELIISKV